MTFLLVVCPRCGAPRVVQSGPRSTSCTRCRKHFELASALTLAESDSIDAVQGAYGKYNAERAGRKSC